MVGRLPGAQSPTSAFTMKCKGTPRQEHVNTKSPGLEMLSRTRKSPAWVTRDSARWREMLPWYQARDLSSDGSAFSSFCRSCSSFSGEAITGGKSEKESGPVGDVLQKNAECLKG